MKDEKSSWISGEFDSIKICSFCYAIGLRNAVATYKSGIYRCTRCGKETNSPIKIDLKYSEGWPNGKAPVLKTEFRETCGGSNPSPSASF